MQKEIQKLAESLGDVCFGFVPLDIGWKARKDLDDDVSSAGSRLGSLDHGCCLEGGLACKFHAVYCQQLVALLHPCLLGRRLIY